MKKDEVNKNKQAILKFVNEHVSEKGYPPSVREICKAIGFKSTSTVHGYLKRLMDEGQISKDATKPRALKVLGSENKIRPMPNQEDYFLPAKELVSVPVVGKVTAGLPILAHENIEDTFPIPVDYTRNSDVFILKVSGESMIEAGILDGDYILVRMQNTARNGEKVVALIDDEATVKTFYKENGHFRLQPENSTMKPIIVNEVSILGRVSGVFRKM